MVIKIIPMNSLKEFETWSKAYNYFEGLGYMKKIKILEKNKIVIILGYQVSGSLEAYGTKICEETELIFSENVSLEFDKTIKDSVGVDSLLFDGIAFDKKNNSPNFYINDPYFFKISADHFAIKKTTSQSYEVKPFFSPNNIYFELLNGDHLLNPEFWTNAKLGFRMYGAEKFVSTPSNLEGLFLQKEDRLKLNKKGIFINSLKKEKNSVKLSLSLLDLQIKSTWKILLNKIITCTLNGKIESGNISLSISDWLKQQGHF